jgi:predicted lipase
LGGKNVTCITTGSPRVGDPTFADEYFKLMENPNFNFSCYRIVHNCDVVPSVPPQDWNFKHVGEPIWLRKMHNNWSYVYLTIVEEVATRGNADNHEVTSRPHGYGGWVSTSLLFG